MPCATVLPVCETMRGIGAGLPLVLVVFEMAGLVGGQQEVRLPPQNNTLVLLASPRRGTNPPGHEEARHRAA